MTNPEIAPLNLANLTTVEITIRRDNLLASARVTDDPKHRSELLATAARMTEETTRRFNESDAPALSSAALFAAETAKTARDMSDAALNGWARYIGDERRDPESVHLPHILDAIENAVRDELADRIRRSHA